MALADDDPGQIDRVAGDDRVGDSPIPPGSGGSPSSSDISTVACCRAPASAAAAKGDRNGRG